MTGTMGVRVASPVDAADVADAVSVGATVFGNGGVVVGKRTTPPGGVVVGAVANIGGGSFPSETPSPEIKMRNGIVMFFEFMTAT